MGEGEEHEGEDDLVESAVTFSKKTKGDKSDNHLQDIKKRSSVPVVEAEEDYSQLMDDNKNGRMQEVRKGHKPSLSWIDETHDKIIADQKANEESRMSNYRGRAI